MATGRRKRQSRKERFFSKAYDHYDAMRRATFDAYCQDPTYTPYLKFHSRSGRIDLTLQETGKTGKGHRIVIPLRSSRRLSVDEQLVKSAHAILRYTTKGHPMAKGFVNHMCNALEKQAHDRRIRREEEERILHPERVKMREANKKRGEKFKKGIKKVWKVLDKGLEVSFKIDDAIERQKKLWDLCAPLRRFDGMWDPPLAGSQRVRAHTRRTASGETVNVGEYERSYGD